MNQRVSGKSSLTLKNFFQVGIALGLLVALVSGFMWLRRQSSENPVVTEESAEATEDQGQDLHPDDDLDAKMGLDASPTPEKKKSEPVDLNAASDFFGQSIKQLGTCMSLNTASAGDRLEPTFENLVSVVKAELGEPILRSEDWVTWNLRVGNEERRIRIETDYSENEQASRHLLYFKIDPQGQPTLIPLPAEQTKDPSESFIASLQKDGEVYEEEKGERAYFENGQEMVLTEKNGKIDDMEFSNGSKTFRCAGILTSAPSCKCY